MGAGQVIAEYFVRIGADTSGMAAGLNDAKNSMTSLGNTAGTTGVNISALANKTQATSSANERLTDATARANAAMQGINQSIGGFGTILGVVSPQIGHTVDLLFRLGATVGPAVLSLGIAGKAINYAFDMAPVGAQMERLGASFDKLAQQYGGNADSIIAALRAASDGTVASSDLILASNRAMLLGLGADAEKLGQLMEVARFRGRAMGLSTQQAFSDIVTGVGRMSPLILDNLGIMIDAEKTYEEYATAHGKVALALTESEKRQALLNKTIMDGQKQIQAAGGIASDTADKFERLAASQKMLNEEVGKYVSKPVSWVAGARADIADWLALQFKMSQGVGKSSTEGLFGAKFGLKIATGELNDQVAIMARLKASYEAAHGPAAALTRVFVGAQMKESQTEIDRLTQVIRVLKSELGLIPAAAEAGMTSIMRMAVAMAPEMTPGLLMMKGMGTRVSSGPKAGRGMLEDEFMLKPLTDAERAAKEYGDRLDALTLSQRLNDQAVSDARAAYAEFTSVMGGLMQETQVTDMDMQATKLGRYVDKWDEYARRMKAIVAGGAKNEWAKFYGISGTDDQARAQALSNLQAFQKFDFSKMPAKDRDAMKAQLKAAYADYIQTEANKKAFMNEMLGEIGGTKAQAAAFMGDAGGAAGGGVYEGAIAAIKDQGIAQPMADAWRADIAKNADTLKDAGKAAGQLLVAGVTTALTEAAFMTRMAQAVAPEVAAIIERKKGRGAQD